MWGAVLPSGRSGLHSEIREVNSVYMRSLTRSIVASALVFLSASPAMAEEVDYVKELERLILRLDEIQAEYLNCLGKYAVITLGIDDKDTRGAVLRMNVETCRKDRFDRILLEVSDSYRRMGAQKTLEELREDAELNARQLDRDLWPEEHWQKVKQGSVPKKQSKAAPSPAKPTRKPVTATGGR